MIADIVDNTQVILAFRNPKPPTELLEPQHSRLGWPEHHHGIDVWEVHPFVEHVDGKEHIELPFGEPLEAARSGCGLRPGVNGCRPDTLLDNKACHKISVDLRAAEGQGAFPCTGFVLLEHICGALLCGHCPREGILIEASVSPWNVPVVHFIRDAKAAKWAKQPGSDPFHKVASVDEILTTEGQQVPSVRPLRSCGESEEKLRLEIADELSIASCRSVVEFVDASGRISGGVAAGDRYPRKPAPPSVQSS